MKSMIKSLILLAASVAALTAAHADPFFDFYGYSYLDGPSFTVGTLTTVPMRFDPIQPEPPMTLDLVNNEYTVLLDQMQIADVQFVDPVYIVTYANGDIYVHEDPAMNSSWAINPPNAQVPATFQDGTLILIGHFTECSMIFDASGMTGVVQGHVNFTGGTRLNELADPNGWLFFGGTSSNPVHEIPVGYDMAWDPQLLSPIPIVTRPTTWGAIRGLYR